MIDRPSRRCMLKNSHVPSRRMLQFPHYCLVDLMELQKNYELVPVEYRTSSFSSSPMALIPEVLVRAQVVLVRGPESKLVSWSLGCSEPAPTDSVYSVEIVGNLARSID